MPFGLTNAEATFQRTVNCIFHNLAHLILAYLDYLIVQYWKRFDHLEDLFLVFKWCRHYNLWLNPLKCIFYFNAGRLLGFIVSQQGIIVYHLKVQAIKEVPPPKILKQHQILQGKANFLWCFVLDYGTCMQSFLRLLHQDIPFKWDDQAQKSFKALKDTLSSSPLIIPPNYDKYYNLYLSTSDTTITRVLFQDGPNKKEHIIYYVSKNLASAALRYDPEEKISLDLVHSIQKLQHYIILRTTTIIEIINHMWYFLTFHMMNYTYAWLIAII